jgi:hypothetical protein
MAMRVVCASLLLAGCVTASALNPGERVIGCWRNNDAAVAMTWGPDAAGGFIGVVSPDGEAGPRRYNLRDSAEAWTLCERDAAGVTDAQCWPVAQGQGGSLQGGRAFIDRQGERLHIAVADGQSQRIIFAGRRAPCT